MKYSLSPIGGLLLITIGHVRAAQDCNLPQFDHEVTLPTTRPLVVAHRGSSGKYPEHTVEAYQDAVDQGADVIECDVSVTSDLVLICSHESWLNKTTDVATKFPNKLTTKYVHSKKANVTNYFSVDMTLAEIKTLRVKQRFSFRDPSFNGNFQISTLEEYINVAKSAPRPVGIYPETKDPEWVNSLDIIRNASTSFEELLVNALHKSGYTKNTDPCFVQSFDSRSILSLKNMTNLPLIRLLSSSHVVTDDELREWSTIIYGIGPAKQAIIPTTNGGKVIHAPTDLVVRAHKFGLRVHPYTFRNEDRYLAWAYVQDPNREYAKYLKRSSLGVNNVQIDGFFTDFPGTLYAYLTAEYAACQSGGQRHTSALTVVGATSLTILVLQCVILH